MQNLLLLMLLILPALNFAQDCSGKIKAAQASKVAGNYRKALAQFTAAASTCGEERGTEIEAEILDIYDRIEKLKNDAESAKKIAAAEAENAKVSGMIAAESNRKAQVALDSLNIVLEDLGKANAECGVRLLLAEVERNQRELNFDAAVDKLKTAKTMGALPDSVATAYLSLSSALLHHAGEDLRRKEFKPALKKIKSAEELNVQPDSVAILSLALEQFLLENARKDILDTRYDDAADKISALRSFPVPRDTIESLWFEIAFCYTETDRPDRAAAALDTFAQMRHDNTIRNLFPELAGKEPVQQAQLLRKARQQLDPERDKLLTARYLTSVFRLIPTGTIAMGTNPGDAQGGCQVSVNPFLLAPKELTFFEYDLFCAATNRPKPSDNGWGRGLRPVINIDWYDAVEYCNWRSRRDGLQEVYVLEKNPGDGNGRSQKVTVSCNWTANGYRLPTEAEWEFAASNGDKHTRYSWGNELPAAQQVGNVADETIKTKNPNATIFAGYTDGFVYTAPTGSYPPNGFGLYDMTGNVREWCWDWFDENYCRGNKNKIAPQGPATGEERVLRGGSWSSFPDDCLVGNRSHSNPAKGNVNTGFRLARN